MNRSTPGLPVHHQLPESTQTHAHRVRDAIQPSHPLSSPSSPAPNPSSIRVFSNESTLCIRRLKYWSFSFSISLSNEHPGLISFQLCPILCDPHGLYNQWNFPGQNTGVGSHPILQGIFPTQGSKPGLPHCRRILYQLSYMGSPRSTWMRNPKYMVLNKRKF